MVLIGLLILYCIKDEKCCRCCGCDGEWQFVTSVAESGFTRESMPVPFTVEAKSSAIAALKEVRGVITPWMKWLLSTTSMIVNRA